MPLRASSSDAGVVDPSGFGALSSRSSEAPDCRKPSRLSVRLAAMVTLSAV